jgi:hypothetical protein
MAKIELPSGLVLDIVINRISLRESRQVKSPESQEQEDAIIAKAVGITVEEYLDLGHDDWKNAVAEVVRQLSRPLEPRDPNSKSAST